MGDSVCLTKNLTRAKKPGDPTIPETGPNHGSPEVSPR